VVVSGESGSGKTEAARIVLQYVTVAGSGPHVAHQDPSVCPTKLVRDRLLQAGPLLEGEKNFAVFEIIACIFAVVFLNANLHESVKVQRRDCSYQNNL